MRIFSGENLYVQCTKCTIRFSVKSTRRNGLRKEIDNANKVLTKCIGDRNALYVCNKFYFKYKIFGPDYNSHATTRLCSLSN